MPQLNQLLLVYQSQWFWLALVLAAIYFGIGKLMLPKIQSTIEARDKSIADDLAAAQAARAAADETEAAYRARIDESRAEALKVAAAAKASSALATEERMQAANAETQAKVEAAEARIRAATKAALAEIEGVAAEAAQDMVQSGGVSVSAGGGASREGGEGPCGHPPAAANAAHAPGEPKATMLDPGPWRPRPSTMRAECARADRAAWIAWRWS